jgi:DNA-binding CsgD family transcriptional regulator/PAS domain-containing protein
LGYDALHEMGENGRSIRGFDNPGIAGILETGTSVTPKFRPGSDRHLYRTIEHIYAAATDPERWQEAVDDFCLAYPDGHGTLLRHDVNAGTGTFAWTAGFEPGWVEAYNGYFNTLNPWLPNLKKRPIGKAVPAEFMLERERLLKTEFFSDFLAPQSLMSGIGVTIAQDKSRFVAVSVLYPEGAAEERHHLDYLQRLTPHFLRAMQVNQQLEMSAIRGNAAEASLNKLRVGIVLVSAEGKVIFCNQAAEQIMSQSDGLSLTRDGRVAAASLASATKLRQAIDSASRILNAGSSAGGGMIAVDRPSGRSPYSVLVAPIRPGNSEGLAGNVSAALFISHRDLVEDASPDLLMEALGITRTESKLLRHILDGRSIAEAGACMEISIHTARTHLKNIFAKLGFSRQSDLIKHVTSHPVWMVKNR